MKLAVFTFLVCLLFVDVTGQREPKGRCLCQGKGVRFVPKQNIKTLTIHPPNHSCSKTEIIVTLKGNGGKKCIDPDSDIVKKILEKEQAKRRAKTAGPTVFSASRAKTAGPTVFPASRAKTAGPTVFPASRAKTAGPTVFPASRAKTAGPTVFSASRAKTAGPTVFPVSRAKTAGPTVFPESTTSN